MKTSALSLYRFPVILFAVFLIMAQIPLQVRAHEDQTVTVSSRPVVEIPPAIMFHARANQREILPALIDDLLASGYQFTTYSRFYAALQRGERIAKPIILTFDDLTLVDGSSNFRFYAEIVDILEGKRIPAVFAVITEPVVVGAKGARIQLSAQNPDYWQQARLWAREGIEFATHTESHPNLDSPLLTQADLVREIADSARLIEQNLGARVTTLITPYGSGITQAGVINPRIQDALEGTHIHFVVGISVSHAPLAPGLGVYGAGRIMPSDLQADSLLQLLIGETRRWTDTNQAAL